MLELSFRVEKTMTRVEQDEKVRRMKVAFETYAAANPFPGSRHTPHINIEPFPSDKPYTEHGKMRAVARHGDMELSRWSRNAIIATVQPLIDDFPERGISIICDSEGSALKIQPRRKSAA